MSKHTPGPWKIGTQLGFNPSTICDQQEQGVAIIAGIPLNWTLQELEKINNPRHAVPLANARLIAAAPELLEALKEVQRRLKSWPPLIEDIAHACHFDMIDAIMTTAIRKAEEGA